MTVCARKASSRILDEQLRTGLWLHWVRWCLAYRYNEPLGLRWTVLSIAKSARLAIIDSPSDLAAWIERYPRLLRGRHGLNFERLAEDWDGLRLTHEDYLRTRLRRSSPALTGWDCESSLRTRRLQRRRIRSSSHHYSFGYDRLNRRVSAQPLPM
jgi:hypothetical protein